MVLSYSRAVFALFTLDQSLESFLRGHVEAFEAFQGAARTLVPDYVTRHIMQSIFSPATRRQGGGARGRRRTAAAVD